MSISDRVDILLVDDQPAKLLGYEVILNELDENLVKAASAREALDHLLKRDVAVILVDVCMPELDGFELATMIRGHPRFETTPIIFVSAIALTDLDHLKGYEYGAVDYVPVPVIPDVLRAKVRFFTELHRKTRQLEALNSELERRVQERTAELAKANVELEQRVEERTREREAALAQLHEMQKLESLGKITGGLAHDFNNLLTAIIGNLEPLAKRVAQNPSLKHYVEGAIEAAERGANLTTRLLAFARRQELRPEPVDVAHLVNGMGDLLRRSLGPSIELAMEFEIESAAILVDPNQLELALLNLALNSRDAMPEGGRLTVSARRAQVAKPTADGLVPGDYIRIAVTDTGTGMDEATLKRAAEPFFTTKEIGKGTGLGLSMVYGLAAQSGGVAQIRSRPGKGTTIELWLPAADALVEQARRPKIPAVAKPVRFFRVLLVEDDPMVANGTVAMLNDLGHTVTLADCGDRALDIIRTPTIFDLVITDHAMPRMTGVDLAGRIRKLRPSMPVILATGYAELPDGEPSGLRRIDKPYRMDKLAALIEEIACRDMPESIEKAIRSVG